MMNLLPNSEKISLRWTHRYQLLVSVGVAAIILLAISNIIMFSTYLVIWSDDKILNQRIASLRLQYGDREDEILAFDLLVKRLAILLLASTQPSLSEVIDGVLERNVAGVKLNRIFYDTTDKKEASRTLIVEGIAQEREDLVTFVQGIEKEKLFVNVSSPVSSLAKEKNIDFSIQVDVQ